MKKLLILAALLLSTRCAFAWDDGGHMLVARIAYSQLSASAKSVVDTMLQDVPETRKRTRSLKPRAYDFITAACWMDDVRGIAGYDHYKPCHYIDVPCGGNPKKVKAPNAITAINYAIRVLRAHQFGSRGKATELAVLIHLVGDIHQPLHCVDKDLGGNTFPISGVPNLFLGLRRDGKLLDKTLPPTGENAPVYQRLHAFWDSAYRYDVSTQDGKKSVAALGVLGNSSRPDLARIETIAQDLTTHYLPSDTQYLQSDDPADWVQDSNSIACQFAFKTPRQRTPSLAYFARAHDISCQRIALAGYRLAKLLNEIFSA